MAYTGKVVVKVVVHDARRQVSIPTQASSQHQVSIPTQASGQHTYPSIGVFVNRSPKSKPRCTFSRHQEQASKQRCTFRSTAFSSVQCNWALFYFFDHYIPSSVQCSAGPHTRHHYIQSAVQVRIPGIEMVGVDHVHRCGVKA